KGKSIKRNETFVLIQTAVDDPHVSIATSDIQPIPPSLQHIRVWPANRIHRGKKHVARYFPIQLEWAGLLYAIKRNGYIFRQRVSFCEIGEPRRQIGVDRIDQVPIEARWKGRVL